MSAARYPVPAGVHRVTDEVRRSRFITTIARAGTPEEAQAVLRRVRDEYPDATHHCWAYVAGPPGSTARVGMSDDGEPHGTAGRPILNALLHGGVGDIVAVVTRYYGGTKLGTGGLVRAYGGGVRRALESLPRAERVARVTLVVTLEFSRVQALEQLLPDFEASVASRDFAAEARFTIDLPESHAPSFRKAVLDLTRGRARVDLAQS